MHKLSLALTLSTLLTLTLTNNAQAKCAFSDKVDVWPEAKHTITPNQLILLQAHGSFIASAQDKDVNAQYIFKVTPTKGKTYTIKARFIGNFKGIHKHAVVIQPEKALPVGATVTLTNSKLTKGIPGTSWTVQKSQQAEDPMFTDLNMTSSDHKALGCGPSTHMTYNFKGNFAEDTLALARVSDGENAQNYPVVIEHKSESLTLGRSMCEGAFTFEPKADYFLFFSTWDKEGKKLNLVPKVIDASLKHADK